MTNKISDYLTTSCKEQIISQIADQMAVTGVKGSMTAPCDYCLEGSEDLRQELRQLEAA